MSDAPVRRRIEPRAAANGATPGGPWNPEAEEALLGAVLLSPVARADVVDLLRPEMFGPRNGHVYGAVSALHGRGAPVDAVTVGEELDRVGLREHAGGPQRLLDLLAGTPTTVAAAHYASIVGDHWRRRERRRIAHLIDEAASEGHDCAGLVAELGQVASAGPGDIPASWQEINLAETASDEPAPSILRRSDGRRIITPGLIHLCVGPPESGKTWFGLLAAAHALKEGRHVAWVDYETDPTHFKARLRVVGVTDDQLPAMHYMRPEERDTAAVWARLTASVERERMALVILDSFGEALALAGLDEHDGADVRGFLNHFTAPLRAGAALLALDHVTKQVKGRGPWAIGSQSKNARASVVFGVRATEPFAVGRDGSALVTLNKGRGPHLAPLTAGPERVIGRLAMTAVGKLTLEEPEGDTGGDVVEFIPNARMGEIVDYIRGAGRVSPTAIEQNVRGKAATTRWALDLLVKNGAVRITQTGKRNRLVELTAETRPDPSLPVPEHRDGVVPSPPQIRPDLSPPLRGDGTHLGTDSTPAPTEYRDPLEAYDEELLALTEPEQPA